MKTNGFQIITQQRGKYIGRWSLFLLSTIFCITMYNLLITNFVTKKNWIMRSTFKMLFYVNGSKEKNGIVPFMGRVSINGSVAQFSCKLTIAKTMWDAKGNRSKGCPYACLLRGMEYFKLYIIYMNLLKNASLVENS